MTDNTADRVAVMRDHFDLTNRDLARILGITEQSVGQWVNGVTKPGAKAVAEIRRKLGVSEQWLVLGKGPMLAEKETDDAVAELMRIWRDLSPEGRRDALQYFQFLQAKSGKDNA